LKTGLFGTVKLINDRDANKKTKTVGQHQKQERKNRFQTGNYPSNKNASASGELRALSEMKLSTPSKTLYPHKNSEDTKEPKKCGNLLQREDDAITAEKKNKVYEGDTDQSILYELKSFEEDKKYEDLFENYTKIDGDNLTPSTSYENSNSKKEFLGKKTDRSFFDSKEKDKEQNKNNSDNKNKYKNLNNSIKDNKKALDKNTEEIKELNDAENLNNINELKAEESGGINFNGIQEIKINKNEANIWHDIFKKLRRDNGKVAIKRFVYNKYLTDINIKIKTVELKLNKFTNVKAIDVNLKF